MQENDTVLYTLVRFSKSASSAGKRFEQACIVLGQLRAAKIPKYRIQSVRQLLDCLQDVANKARATENIRSAYANGLEREAYEVVPFEKSLSVEYTTGEIRDAHTRKCVRFARVSANREYVRMRRDCAEGIEVEGDQGVIIRASMPLLHC